MPVRTLDFHETIVQQCKKMNNKWSEAVKDRISRVHDLPHMSKSHTFSRHPSVLLGI